MNLTPNDIRSRLELACEKAGGQRALARKAAVSVTYINEVLNGRVAAGRAILEMLGLERVTIVRPKRSR